MPLILSFTDSNGIQQNQNLFPVRLKILLQVAIPLDLKVVIVEFLLYLVEKSIIIHNLKELSKKKTTTTEMSLVIPWKVHLKVTMVSHMLLV